VTEPDARPAPGPAGGAAAGGPAELRVATGFVPSRHGLRFANAFPDGPAVTVDLGVARLGVGNAARGLCGGMVFAALDYWTAALPPPGDTGPPDPGTPLFRYLVRRLVDSWGLPAGPLTYLTLMHPLYPDGDRALGPLTLRGRAWRMVTREWPVVRARLEAGRPCPLGLVTVSSGLPTAIGENHQVLAYRYDQAGTVVRIGVYDPNQPGADDVDLVIDLADPTGPVQVSMTSAAGPGRPVLCFFAVPYVPRPPPGPDA
jgi:hypothetical protein